MIWDMPSTYDVQRYLPVGAFVIMCPSFSGPANMKLGDIDGDQELEMVLAYKWNGCTYVSILKQYKDKWERIMDIKSKGYDIVFLDFISMENTKKKDLVIGWWMGGIWSQLNVFSWKDNSLKKVIKNFMYSGFPSEEEIYLLKKRLVQKEERQGNLFPASMNTINGIKWGYINQQGDFIVSPIYEEARDFQENNLAIVKKNNKYGVIDQNGNFIVQPIYEYINDFSEKRAIANDESGFKVIDEKGKILFESEQYIGHFQNKRAIFVEIKNEEWFYGYIDKQGKVIIFPQYKTAYDFKEDKAVVQLRNGNYSIIGNKGEILQLFKYAYVGDLGDGYLSFKEQDGGKYGFINEKGKIMIEPRFTGVEEFKDGRAVVNLSEDFRNQFGLINKKGEFLIEPKYNDIRQIGEKRVAVGEVINPENPFMGSRYAIGNINGDILTDFIYYFVSPYENDFASAYDEKETFFIDLKGKRVKNLPSVNGSGELFIKDNIIQGNIDRRILYIDFSGRVIYEQNKEIVLKPSLVLKEEKYKPNRNYLVYYPNLFGMEEEIQKKANQTLVEMSKANTQIKSSDNLDYSYDGDFSIEFLKENLLVLELEGYEYHFGAAHGMPFRTHGKVDLKTGKFYELKELFKENSDYVKVLSDLIEKQINEEEYDYIWKESYKGIKENQPFYVKEEAIYLYFEPYEIAPYAAGFPTFKIEYIEIEDIIEKQGLFWKSFH